MTETELIGALSGRRSAGLIDGLADRIRREASVGGLYRLVADPARWPVGADRSRILFRGGCVLERIYFADRAAFLPWAGDFCSRGFSACEHPGLRRLFAKIMADLLERLSPDTQSLEEIAETAAGWAAAPGTKIAVRIWAMEVLKRCRGRVAWVDDAWEDLLELQMQGASPGIEKRLRHSWRR